MGNISLCQASLNAGYHIDSAPRKGSDLSWGENIFHDLFCSVHHYAPELFFQFHFSSVFYNHPIDILIRFAFPSSLNYLFSVVFFYLIFLFHFFFPSY